MRITPKNLDVMLRRSFSKDYYNYNYMMNQKAFIQLIDFLNEDPQQTLEAVYRLGFMQGKRSTVRGDK